MRLIISEKRSVAMAYANALNVTAMKTGYIEGNDFIITWCIGHLVEFASADTYDERYKKWNIVDLPIIPKEWKYIVSADKKKQFEIVKNLMNDNRVTEVICGTDAGREGELIFRLVYEKAGCKLPIKRLWVSSMEEKAIVQGFNNLKDGSEYENLYQSALCRSKSDWIIGINGTRIYSKIYNKKLNVGRVQTPTLAMLYERDNAISGFQKEKYYNVLLNDIAVLSRIKSQPEAAKIKTECDGKVATVSSVKRERKTINPPKLYDLTTLQREANRFYGFTAQQTLDYVQSLYEMKLVTYPRTDSQFLTEDMSETCLDIVNIILQNIPDFNDIPDVFNTSRVIDDKRVSDHHAIIPTVELASVYLDNIPDGERKILFLIANKLLCATADKHEYEAITAEIVVGGYVFVAGGNTVINPGWKGIDERFRTYQKSVENTDESALGLIEGQEFTAECKITEHYTSPPKQFTEDTLLSSMERAGTDEITEEVERSGLGTPATRAGVIEKLIKSGFVKRDKRNLKVTTEGAELISLMPDFIKSAKLTADWENGLSLISQGKLSAEQFMNEIYGLTAEIITTAKENIDVSKVSWKRGDVIGKCPRCSDEVCETANAYSCPCGFILWKNNRFFQTAKTPLTKEIVAALLKDGKTEVQGLYSPKKGATYNAVVCLDDTGTYVNFKLEFKKGI